MTIFQEISNLVANAKPFVDACVDAFVFDSLIA